MSHHTRGIVLHTRPYSETSCIVSVYTELFGLESYLIRGVRGKHAKIRTAVLQPLSLVEMVVHHREARGLQRASEITPAPPLASIPFDIRKISIALFLSEALTRCIREQESNRELFDFIHHAVHLLELQTENLAGFHLLFLVRLTRYLGFYPQGSYSRETPFFNLPDGSFQAMRPLHPQFIADPLSASFGRLLSSSFETANLPVFSHEQRSDLLGKLLEYYSLHVSGFSGIRSAEVLEEAFAR